MTMDMEAVIAVRDTPTRGRVAFEGGQLLRTDAQRRPGAIRQEPRGATGPLRPYESYGEEGRLAPFLSPGVESLSQRIGTLYLDIPLSHPSLIGRLAEPDPDNSPIQSRISNSSGERFGLRL